MFRFKWIAVLTLLLALSRPGLADANAGIRGAWNPAWAGTEQSRPVKLEGDRLQVLMPWRVMPNWAETGMTRSIMTLERNK
jgi:hypothetical protein